MDYVRKLHDEKPLTTNILIYSKQKMLEYILILKDLSTLHAFHHYFPLRFRHNDDEQSHPTQESRREREEVVKPVRLRRSNNKVVL